MNRISSSSRSTTHEHERTYGRHASPLSGQPSRRRARTAGAGRKALLVLSLTLVAGSAVTAAEAKVSYPQIGGFRCFPLQYYYIIEYPRGPLGDGFFRVVTDGVATYNSPRLYWNGSYWQKYTYGSWWRTPPRVGDKAVNVYMEVYWYSYRYRTWYGMGGCTFPRGPGL